MMVIPLRISFPALRSFKSLKRSISRKYSTVVSEKNETEYVRIPQYPPIFDPTKEGIELTERLNWYESIQKMATVDEKLLEICHSIDLYKFKAYQLSCKYISYKELDFLQHCTSTHIINELPKVYGTIEVDHLINQLEEPLLESIVFEKSVRKETRNLSVDGIDQVESSRMFNSLLHTLLLGLSNANKQLTETEIIKYPRCNSFWWHKDFTEKVSKKERNVCFQFTGQPCFQLRVPLPLTSIVDRNDPLCNSSDLPTYEWPMKSLCKPFKSQCITMVPGFWNGDACEFPFLTLDSLHYFRNYKRLYGNHGLDEALKGMALLGSFGWLLGIAANQGFTPFDELTYPITTQTVLSNGQEWHFFVYQLNTVALHKDVWKGTHHNLMWYSGPMTLYETIEDGIPKGVNNEVLKLLIKFFLNRAPEKVDFELKPYCSKDLRPFEHQVSERVQLHRYFDNRPDNTNSRFQIPTWHHIYKYNKHANPSPRVKLW